MLLLTLPLTADEAPKAHEHPPNVLERAVSWTADVVVAKPVGWVSDIVAISKSLVNGRYRVLTWSTGADGSKHFALIDIHPNAKAEK